MFRQKYFFLSSFLCFFLIFVSVLPTNAAAIKTSGDFKYTISNSRVTIKKYTGKASNVIVPSSINGKTVDSIDASAFYKNSAIKSLTLSSGITTMDYASIYKCSKLTTLILPKTLLDITSQKNFSTFKGCDCLKYIQVDPKNKHFYSKDNILYEYVTSPANVLLKKVTICYYPHTKKAKSFQLPENLAWMPTDNYITKNGTIFNNPYLKSFSLCTPKNLSAKKKILKTRAKISTGDNSTKTVVKKSFRITLKWNRISPASGYYLYEASKKNGKYKKIATIYQSYNASYPEKASYVLYRTYDKKFCYYRLQAFTNGYKNGKKSVITSGYTSSFRI